MDYTKLHLYVDKALPHYCFDTDSEKPGFVRWVSPDAWTKGEKRV